MSPDVARSLVGITLLAIGAVTLIALALPGQGTLTTWWRDFFAPWFGTGRWILPFVLIASGIYVERAPTAGRWQLTLVGAGIAFLAVLGLLHVIDVPLRSGGRIGTFLGQLLVGLMGPVGAFIVLAAVGMAGLVIMLDTSLRALVAPIGRGALAVGDHLAAPSEESEDDLRGGPDGQLSAELDSRGRFTRRGGPLSTALSGGIGSRVGIGVAGGPVPGSGREPTADELPAPIPSPAPMSQTVWSGRPGGVGEGSRGESLRGQTATSADLRAAEPGGGALVEDGPALSIRDVAWVLPSPAMLEERPVVRAGAGVDHSRNIQIIEDKLRSFQIPAKVIATNSGPVVTQYEVKPEAHVKLSRIEGLADDLAMALAARSIRIEAPIPGKNVVGIEIPNHSSEVVGFRALIEDADMLAATSSLTFALGRDVSGKAFAVDLARMPHLLVAGATGSGKSVCVNALITSILMHARPDEVRLLLVDLKRVELAPYDGLPHLLQHVIVETHEAKAALNWAVHEMEERYKLLASRTVRNIAGYNDKVGPDARLPFVVLVIDELADLIMREGRKVEDPIVKIAQKARAVGIHLVLATQRPSVNVVTGLIKANVPSRIAFAMSSNVDSRTVLDQPGAEDLIGRGDMLYQPVDLPRPVRMQGVFVSDREVTAVTEHWRSQVSEPFYEESIFAFVDGEEGGNGGQFAWLAKMVEDDMAVRAAELVIATGRASTSMLQTKLKVGFSRASRLMDEMERYGIIGPQDPRNPAAPRIVYGPDNWLRSMADIDDPGD